MNSRGGLGRCRLNKLYALALACTAMWVTLTAEASDAEEAYFSVFPETAEPAVPVAPFWPAGFS